MIRQDKDLQTNKNSQADKDSEKKDLDDDLSQLQEEISQLEELGKDKEKDEEKNEELEKLKELLARTQADYQNFKMRIERDREDMMFFLKYEIFRRILPRIDDLERMIKNTSESERNGALYEGILALERSLRRDLDALGVRSFGSIGEDVDPQKHEVIAQVPSKTPGKIVDEVERGYMLGDRILRVAKVIVGSEESGKEHF